VAADLLALAKSKDYGQRRLGDDGERVHFSLSREEALSVPAIANINAYTNYVNTKAYRRA
jgi:hypothetical protein